MIKVSLRRLEEAGELGRALVDGIPGAGLLVLDGDFRILLADGEVHGERDHDAFLMHRLSEVVPPGAWETLGPHLVAALGGEAQSFEYEVVGKPSWHWLRLAPIRDAGAVIGVLVLSQDITTQVSTHRMLADSERLKSSVLSVLDEGVVVVDLDGHLLEANPAARTILGLQREGASQDANWWETLAARRGGEDSDLDVGAKVIATGQGIWDVKLEIDRPDGATVLLSANYLPLRDDHRDVSGLVLSFRDVTARVSEQRRVLELQDRLLEAHQVARLASWEWRSASDDVVVFRALPESEVNSGERASVEAFLALVPDEERQTLREDLVAFARGERDESIRRHRHDLPSRVSWLETRAHAVRDQAGNLTCVRGTSQDVTEQELAKQELARSRDFLQETLDSLTGHVAVLDEQGEIMATNRAWGQFASDNGGDPEQARGNYLAACDSAVGDEWAVQAAKGLRGILAGREVEFSMEYPCNSPSVRRWFVLRATRYSGPGNARVVVNHGDVTQRRRAGRQIAMQAALLDEIDVAVVATDLERHITHWNRGAERLYGWTSAEVIGRKAGELIAPTDGVDVSISAGELHRVGHWEGEFDVIRKDGSSFPAYVRDRIVTSDDGSPAGIIGVSVDMSERVAAQRELLATRNYLQAVTDSVGEGLYTADTEGRLTYMNEAAERMLGWSWEEAKGRVMHDLAHCLRPDGSDLPIAECPILRTRRDGESVHVEDEVFVCRDGSRFPVAYTASPFSTEDGVQGCVVAFEDVSERRAREARLQRDVEKLAGIERIQEALAEERFLLYAQPIVDLRTGAVAQQELLLRVREAGGEIVGPASYLPIAEEYGLVGDIDRWVIQRAAEIAASSVAIHVNVSARSIGDQTIVAHIEHCLQQTGADPSLIVFEITETALVADEAAAVAFAEQLHCLGCKLALDDFGTGYGTFTYLKHLPVDYLKIDIEFVRDLRVSAASRHVVEAVVALARAFSLQTVGEGVEDPETLELLRELGVDFAQGYQLGRPTLFERAPGRSPQETQPTAPQARATKPQAKGKA
jgi:PAS domain S-box-containing protein